MHGAGHPRRPATPRQTPPRRLQSVHGGRKSPGTKKKFLSESGRKSNGSTVSFKPLEEVGLQGGAGRLRKRAVSSAILVTRRLLMSVHTRARNAVSSTRLAMSRLRRGNRCGFSRRLRCDGSSAVGAGPRPEHLTVPDYRVGLPSSFHRHWPSDSLVFGITVPCPRETTAT